MTLNQDVAQTAITSSFLQRLATVIIPARNAESTIGEQLRALGAQTHTGPWELLVIDNGSVDATVRVVQSHVGLLPSIRILSAHDRAGVSYARNVGIEAAEGDALLFCDADDVVSPDWMRSLLIALDRDDAAGGPLDVETFNSGDKQSGATVHSPPMDSLPRPFSFLPFAPGGNCAIRSSVLQRMDRFDESFHSGEEIEFFWRLQRQGFSLGFASDAVVSYRWRSSPRSAMKAGFIKARASARLYRDFRSDGIEFNVFRAILEYPRLLARSYRLLGSHSARLAWLVRLSQTVGRLVGGIRYRVVYF